MRSTTGHISAYRVAIVFPADPERRQQTRLEGSRFAQTAAALAEKGIAVEAAPYVAGAVEQLREQLMRVNGVLVSTETGRATAHALENLQERGILFVGPGEQVYEGQVCGEHCRDNDLPVNVCREKKLTNVRASGAEKNILLKPPRQMTLELALEYIEDDELVEVTPRSIRMRKTYLKESDRKKIARQEKDK